MFPDDCFQLKTLNYIDQNFKIFSHLEVKNIRKYYLSIQKIPIFSVSVTCSFLFSIHKFYCVLLATPFSCNFLHACLFPHYPFQTLMVVLLRQNKKKKNCIFKKIPLIFLSDFYICLYPTQ